MPRRTWPDDKAARFARDWNLGMSTPALREKYGVKAPGCIATELRKRGFVLIPRKPNQAVPAELTS